MTISLRISPNFSESSAAISQNSPAKINTPAQINLSSLVKRKLLMQPTGKPYPDTYKNVKTNFDSAVIALKNEIYENYEENDPILVSDKVIKNFFQVIFLFKDIMEGFSLEKNIYKEFKKHMIDLSWWIEDWVDSLESFVKKELTLLRSLLPQEDQLRIQSQINAINCEINKIKIEVNEAIPLLTCFEKSDYKDEASSIIKALGRINHIKKMTKAKVKSAPELEYGSLIWYKVVEKRPKQEESRLQKLWRYLQPSSWSESTKNTVHVFLVGMQLSHKVINSVNELGKAPLQPETASNGVSKEEMTEIQREAALLGNLLSTKFLYIKEDPSFLLKFTKNLSPNTQRGFQTIFQDILEQPSSESILSIIDAFQNSRIAEIRFQSHPFSFDYENWWFPASSEEACQEKTKPKSAPFLLSSGSPLGNNKELVEKVELLREVISSNTHSAQQTPPISFLETLSSKAGICYSIPQLEKSIGKLIEPLRIQLELDPKILEKHGKKHTNNLLQEKLIKALSFVDVQVPEMEGVDSDIILNFLQQSALEIFGHWAALGELYETYEGGDFLGEEMVRNHLNSIERAIFRAFNSEKASEKLKFSAEFDKWLNKIQQTGDYLMVRSTGAEDTSQVVNAGGNKSIAYVFPDKINLCKALGEVVASYFGAGSLQNRINANQNPFQQKLQLAVHCQRLIGEKIGGSQDITQIPVSIVIFTNEPVYTNFEKFRIMRISATYGHGEGVVGYQGISTDTVLIVVSDVRPDKLYFVYDNKMKPERLAPIQTEEGIVLNKVRNPEMLINRPALTPDLLTRLYHWVVVGEKFFDEKPMDMEIVVKEDIVCPVQVREVVRPALNPTFLDKSKLPSASSPIKDSLYGEKIVLGLGSAFFISQREEIIVADTLELAEKKFQEGKHRLIIVQQSGPENSHSIVNFSTLGIPCLLAQKMDAERLLNEISQDYVLMVCVQTASIHLWEIAKGDPEAFISKGFAFHPAATMSSLPLYETIKVNQRPKIFPSEIKQKLRDIKNASSSEYILEALNEVEQHSAIKNIREKFQLFSRCKEKDYKELRLAFQVIEAYLEQLDRVVAEVKETARLRKEGRAFKFLFWVKNLENLLIGNLEKKGSLNQYSLNDIDLILQDAEELVDYINRLSHASRLSHLLKLGNQSFTKQVKESWKAFLLDLEQQIKEGKCSLKKIEEFEKNVSLLDRANVLHQWLTFLFSNNFNQVMQTFPKTDIPFIEEQLSWRESLHYLENQLDLFADPSTFEVVWEQLLQHVSDEKQIIYSQHMQTASLVVQMILLKNMHTLVDVFDRAIKVVKVSEKRNDDEKIALMREMLIPFFHLLKTWCEHLIDENSIKTHEKWPLSAYLEMLQSFLLGERESSKTQLLPSIDFSVSAALLNALTEFSRHFPVTLEDLFTLLHQNLELILSHKAKEIFSDSLIERSYLSGELKSFIQIIDAKYPMKTALDINMENIDVKYNIPLRNHSAQLILTYHVAHKSIVLNTRFLGMARQRWSFLHELAFELEKIGVSSEMRSATYTNQELVIEWQIRDSNQLEWVLRVFDCMCGYSKHRLNDVFLKDLTTVLKADKNQSDQEDLIIKILESLVSKNLSQNFETTYICLIEAWLSNDVDQQLINGAFQKMILSDEAAIRQKGLGLLRFLAEKKKALAIGMQFIENAVKDSNFDVKVEAFLLLKALANYDRDPLLLKIAHAFAYDSNSLFRREALRTIAIFVRNQMGYSIALEVAEKLLRSPQIEEREEAYWLFGELVVKGEAIIEAKQSLKKGLDEMTSPIKERVIQLIADLAHYHKIRLNPSWEYKFRKGEDIRSFLSTLLKD